MQLTPRSARTGTVFSCSHSPAPYTFNPVLSISRWSGPSGKRPGETDVVARRLKVVWSGPEMVTPSSLKMDFMKPSVWRSDRWNANRTIRAVSIAVSE
jgi:hypothetical protein